MQIGNILIPERFIGTLPHFRVSGPTIGGISGGRTSALMHVLSLAANAGMPGLYRGVFANTGAEDVGTLTFLRNIDDGTGFPLVWVEYRQPKRLGDAPKASRYAIVTHATASRDKRPFEEYLNASRAYRREAKGIGPAALGAMRRLCTSYLKIRTMHKYAQSLWGEDGYDHMVGLRADEPERVGRLKGAYTSVTMRTPLADAGITKADVLEFWSQQPFDLGIAEHRGNCTLCFLKDEADQATVMYELPEESDWWVHAQEVHGDWRAGKASTRTISVEAKVRIEVIRPAVADGATPNCPAWFEAEPTWLAAAKAVAGPARAAWTDRQWAKYRWTLIVRQEERRLRAAPGAFSCACESAQVDLD